MIQMITLGEPVSYVMETRSRGANLGVIRCLSTILVVIREHVFKLGPQYYSLSLLIDFV